MTMRKQWWLGAGLVGMGLGLSGCGHLPFGLHAGATPEYVYVTSKGTYIRDRLAPVSNHVENIVNGERLTVVEHDRRFYKVKTPDGKVGWIEEHSVVDQAGYDRFEALAKQHAQDPVVATGVLRDVIFLHITPGRKTDHLFLLPANDTLKLLRRASVPKPLPPQDLLAPKSLKPRAARPARVEKATRQQSGSTVFAEAPPHPDRYAAPDLDPNQPWMQQPMEDWWLVRDQGGKVGWVLARGLDVTVPDEVAQYSEGRKIVGAYLLNTVMDSGEAPEKRIGPKEQKKLAERAAKKAVFARKHPAAAAAEQDAVAAAPAPVPHPVGQYVTVTSEYKDGLPYDWDQVRVFIWNRAKHRYETAYRLREQQGYLPVAVGKEMVDKMGEEPTFTIETTPDGVVTQDADGVFHPKTVQKTQYRLEGGIVRRDTPVPGEVERQAARKAEQDKRAAERQAGRQAALARHAERRPAGHAERAIRGHRRRR